MHRRIETTSFYLFRQHFPDSDACLAHLMRVRYGGTEIDFPKCGVHSKFYRETRDPAYICRDCKHHTFPCAGTFMHRTHLPLHKWFYAMFLFTSSRRGVAAKELERQLDVSYPTAWRMAHLIRKHMDVIDGEWSLDGEIEANETYVGGEAKGPDADSMPARPPYSA
ncbi:MAG: IS1595 family transposase [Albidovulum sp.]|nr:IS1595 family transposase [Albidovulum sp.]